MPSVPTQNEESFPFEAKWAVAIKAANRRLPDAIARRIYDNQWLARAVQECTAESQLPQLQTLSWMRDVLLQVVHGKKLKPR